MHLIPEGRYIRKQTLSNAERYITEELKGNGRKNFRCRRKINST